MTTIVLDTANTLALMTARALAACGVRRAVLSPGSRNAPLCMALECCAGIETAVVIDERSAAFVALGMAAQTAAPVAMTCTSGTAPLNYAPAMAEAYYRHLPLIAVTADRPARIIDCLDSQTIRQPGIFANFVKATVDIDCADTAEEMLRGAVAAAMTEPRGPVHVNVRIDDPIGALADCDPAAPLSVELPASPAEVSPLPDFGTARRVMVTVSCGRLSPQLDRALELMAARRDCIVVHDPTANCRLGAGRSVACPDLFFSTPPPVAPDLILSVGGAPLSSNMKRYLRSLPSLRHWSIAQPGRPDTYGALEHCLAGDPAAILSAIAAEMPQGDTGFATEWLSRAEAMDTAAACRIASGPFTALKATCSLIAAMPADTILHLSNGMTVRYAQYARAGRLAAVYCNRGVSGIDGCTSTAIGAAMATAAPVCLITGDMSAQYDMGALAIAGIPGNFRMAVLCNGGGNIFRHIGATRGLPCRERCLVADVRLPLADLCRGLGLAYFHADSAGSLDAAAADWLGPAVLQIDTDGEADASDYIKLSEYVNTQLDSNQGIQRHTL